MLEVVGVLPHVEHEQRHSAVPDVALVVVDLLAALKTNENNPLRRAVQTISEVTAALDKPQDAVSTPVFADKTRPVQVEVVGTTDGSIQLLMGVLSPVVGPLASALVIIVIATFMLIAGTDLRDRLIHLVGRGRLRVTTQALDEVTQRIGRYLRAQLLLNASFGLAVTVGLYFIGIPNAVFWGLLGMVLRFLPYIGPWLAAVFPVALSIAIFESWTEPLLTVGLFVAIELVANSVEAWLYGATSEISPLAVIVSALFWTWLWGGVGLVLATPLTVCLAVAGKYLPDLSFLNLLMGDKPSIDPGDRLYQRLLALNEEEACEFVEQHAREQTSLAAFDEAVLPALRSIEADFRSGVLSDVARADAWQILRQIIDDLAEPRAAPDGTTAPILCIPASHEGDELAALMLAQVWRNPVSRPRCSHRNSSPPNPSHRPRPSRRRSSASPRCHRSPPSPPARSANGCAPSCPRHESSSGCGSRRRPNSARAASGSAKRGPTILIPISATPLSASPGSPLARHRAGRTKRLARLTLYRPARCRSSPRSLAHAWRVRRDVRASAHRFGASRAV